MGKMKKNTNRNIDSFAIKLSCKFISSGNLQRKDLLNYGIDRPSQIYLHLLSTLVLEVSTNTGFKSSC